MRYRGALVIIAALLVAVIVPLTISSNRIDRTTIRQTDVQAVAEHWASGAGWSVTGGVNAAGDQVLVEATGPNPAPRLATLRHDLHAAVDGLDVRVSLVPASYQPLPG